MMWQLSFRPTRTLLVSLWLLCTLCLGSGCDFDAPGCGSDEQCSPPRICDTERRICVSPDRDPPPDADRDADALDVRVDTEPTTDSEPETDSEPSTDTELDDTPTPTPDTRPPEILFADEFDDGDLDGWESVRSTRSARFRDDFVVFAGAEGGGAHDSKAIWDQYVPFPQAEGVRVQGRFKMRLLRRQRDQRIAIAFQLRSADGDELGQIKFYTRWEGKEGPVSDKCAIDNGRGWCTYGATNPWITAERTEYFFDIQARDRWGKFDRSLETILRDHLTGVPTDRIATIRIRILSIGAKGRTSRGLFDYVRMVR